MNKAFNLTPVILFGFFIVISNFTVSAGVLDDFEADATKDRKEERSSTNSKKQSGTYSTPRSNSNTSTSKRNRDDSCGGLAECIIGGIFELLFKALVNGVSNSAKSSSADYSNSNSRMQSYRTRRRTPSTPEFDDVTEFSDPIEALHLNEDTSTTKRDITPKTNSTQVATVETPLDNKLPAQVAPNQKTMSHADQSQQSLINGTNDKKLTQADTPDMDHFETNETPKFDYSIPVRQKNKNRIQFGFANQELGKDITAILYRLSGNNGGNIDYAFNLTKYTENDPNDELFLSNFTLGYRFALAPELELGAGIGLNNLSGNSSTNGLSINFPVHIHPTKNIELVLSPSVIDFNGTELLDLNAYGNFRYKKVGLLLGFRSLQSPNENLTGPYAGLTIQF